MLTLFGVSVTAENARHIVASLFADGSPAAMSAAATIQKGVDRDLYAVALEPEERNAILARLLLLRIRLRLAFQPTQGTSSWTGIGTRRVGCTRQSFS